MPASIVPESRCQPAFFAQMRIETDEKRAGRVRDSIYARISPAALDLVETVFFSCMPDKEAAMLRFLLKAYRQGPKVMDMLGDPAVAPLLKAEKHLLGERQLLLGFIRFSDYDGNLAAAISPKNFVLPFLADHFIRRYSGENFMIFDKVHKAALIYQGGRAGIISVEHIEFPEASVAERQYRTLWKRFYDTIGIEARYNPKCRMTHMPKRYWENMLEVKDLL
jgi:probable DNA metabolism protein